MLYNLVQYLRNQFPTETFFPNVKFKATGNDAVPDSYTIVIENTGTVQSWTRYTVKPIQILSRDIDTPKARALSFSIFDLFSEKGQFGLILPAITVDGTLFAAVQTAQINPIQEPSSLGFNSEGLSEFSFNLNIIYERS